MDFLSIKSDLNPAARGIFPGKPKTSIFQQIDAWNHAGLEFEILQENIEGSQSVRRNRLASTRRSGKITVFVSGSTALVRVETVKTGN